MCAVCASNKVIRDAGEFYHFRKNSLTVLQSDYDDTAMENCFYEYISEN